MPKPKLKPCKTRITLLPCPMCGDAPRVLRKSTVTGQCTIYCGKFTGHVVRVDGQNVTEACRMWNTRATPAEAEKGQKR